VNPAITPQRSETLSKGQPSELFHVKHRRACHLADDLRLDAPLVTVEDHFAPLSCAPTMPR